MVIARDGEPRIFRRDGQPVPLADEPLRTPLARDSNAAGTNPYGTAPDALAALHAAHAARGVVIDATAEFPRWEGEPLDAQLAVRALLTAGNAAATPDR